MGIGEVLVAAVAVGVGKVLLGVGLRVEVEGRVRRVEIGVDRCRTQRGIGVPAAEVGAMLRLEIPGRA